MGDYLSYNCTVKGQRYVERDKPCEDSSISYSGDGIHVAIIADGHGDPKCFRSNVGSRIACETVLQSMKTFAAGLRELNREEDLFRPQIADRLIGQLFHTILGNWNAGVLQDLADHPPTEEEYASAGEKNAAIYRSGFGLPHIYGTTLIAMLMTEKYLLVIQQGDGRCIIFHENGSVDQPVPWDPSCEGRFTTSLCDEDAKAHWRSHVIDLRKDRIIACYAESDGVEDSFETADENNAYIAMLTSEYVNMGRNAFLRDLPEHFSMISRQGSRDDISLGCIINESAAEPYVELYRLLHEYHVAEGENRRANERLNSMKRKFGYLTEQLEKAREKLDTVAEKKRKSLHFLELIRHDFNKASKDVEADSMLHSEAEREMSKVQQEYDSFMNDRSVFIDKADNTACRMKEISQRIHQLQQCHADLEESEVCCEDELPIYVQLDCEDPDFAESLAQEESDDQIFETEDVDDGLVLSDRTDNSDEESSVSL